MEDNMRTDSDQPHMVTSGARGNWMQFRQIAGMRGLVSEPEG
jgi:DNA-directed RNA polymerase subunit beta'